MPNTARHGTEFDPGRGIRARAVAASAILFAAASIVCAAPSAAQSLHGCVDLDQTPVPSVEGLSGMFYRIDPDLLMDARMPAPTIDSLSAISRNLAERGSRLVYVPVPTKAMVEPQNLGPKASSHGFDVRLARALYADSVAHLRSQEITAVDGLAALADRWPKARVFFATDPRMSDDGLRLLAQATAEEVGDDYLGGTTFTTTEGEAMELASHDRFLLQMSCQGDLPKVESRAFTTIAETEGAHARPVAVVGSTITGGDSRNFVGFLSDALRRRVTHQVFAADSHAALARYLTSDRFRTDRPDLIVWLVPIWESPARFGDQPFRELAAAAADDCGPGRAADPDRDGSYRVSLDGLSRPEGSSLRLDNGDTPVASAVFRFASPDGRERVRSVLRRTQADATPRVYMPLSGLWPEGVASVSVELDHAAGTRPMISVCRG